ncbi:Uma2 family endonuclease [Archangium lansingense]|uniref:Uma2 family endonuclease n=2 Tax=Archangium lansingense TaxID=2995310 RepID=A0ABT4AN89_9BACT|nr:Uma2 family endonuclease [Archangium lansinium]MCY1083162.1 Uma2 family endonuclease [Archangium lansinium]
MTAMLSPAPLSHLEFPPLRRKGLELVSRSVTSRSAALHAYAASQLGAELIATYGAGRGSAGNSSWLLLSGLEIHLGQSVLAPDLIGWRRERLPRMSRGSSGIALAPDWVCEVLSHPEERAQLLPLYAHEGIRHVWLVDPEVRTLEVLQLDGRRYSLTALHSGTGTVRAEPFGALELPLRLLWAE